MLARILVVPEALARAMDRWHVFPAAVATKEEIASVDRGAQGVHTRRQGPCTPLTLQLRCATTRVASGKTGNLGDLEERWGRMDAAAGASYR